MQLKLLAGTWAKKRFAFGGALLKGSHPKKKRPFRPGLALHVVLRASAAQGPQSFFAHNNQIARIIEKQATRQFVKIHGVANSGNHIHLLVQASSQDHLSHFMRAITGRIAQLVNAQLVKLKSGGGNRFWDARPFSRVVAWGRDFKSVARYLGINALEAVGFSRQAARNMHEAIHLSLKRGLLKKSPSLLAAGFG